MKVELEPIELQPPAGIEAATVYRVIAVEEKGTPVRLQIGTVTNVRGPTWSMMLKPEHSEGEPLEILLNAGTLDELKTAIRDRFGLLDISADRMSDTTMSDFVREMLRQVSQLATNTNTVAGFTSALVYHLALIGAVDMKPEGRDAYLEAVTSRIRAELATIVTMHESRGLLKGALRDMLDKILTRDGDAKPDDPIKH